MEKYRNERCYPDAQTPMTILTVSQTSIKVDILGIIVTNQSSTESSFRIALRPKGATLELAHYTHKDLKIPDNDVYVWGEGIMALPNDIIEVYSDNGQMSFNIFYKETT